MAMYFLLGEHYCFMKTFEVAAFEPIIRTKYTPGGNEETSMAIAVGSSRPEDVQTMRPSEEYTSIP